MALDTANALVTWATAQTLLGFDAGQKDVAEFYLNMASLLANRETGRALKARDYDVQLDGNGSADLLLPEYPINLLTAVYVDTDRSFGSTTEISDMLSYSEYGLVRRTSGTFPEEPKAIRVVYNAGYGYDGADIPQDLQLAVIEIISYSFSRMGSAPGGGVGIRSIKGPDGLDTSYELTIPMNAKRLLGAYRGVRA